MNARERIPIQADPELAGIIPGYLENRQKDVIALEDALESGDFERIRGLGHCMRGTGSSYGFEEITALGIRLEHSAGERDLEAIRSAIAALRDYLSRIEVRFGPA